MASIKISELRPAGSELLHDSESFLNELSDRELSVLGGSKIVIISLYTVSVGISLVTASVVTKNGNGNAYGHDKKGGKK